MHESGRQVDFLKMFDLLADTVLFVPEGGFDQLDLVVVAVCGAGGLVLLGIAVVEHKFWKRVFTGA